MTDPLTSKELVEKSYEYLNRLSRECSKSLLDDLNKSHRKFSRNALASEMGSLVMQWFEKRDKNVRLAFDPSSVKPSNITQIHARFKGNTKDADFSLGVLVGTFVVPGGADPNNLDCFVKTLVVSADKNDFSRRK